jgi:hypothetical protein
LYLNEFIYRVGSGKTNASLCGPFEVRFVLYGIRIDDVLGRNSLEEESLNFSLGGAVKV